MKKLFVLPLFIFLWASIAYGAIDDWTVTQKKLDTVAPKVQLTFALKSAPSVVLDTVVIAVDEGTTDAVLAGIASRRVKQLDAIRQAFIAISNKTVTLTEPVIPPPPTPDPARDAFISAQDLVIKYQAAVDQGLTDAKGSYAARLSAAVTDMKSKYIEAYLPLVRTK